MNWVISYLLSVPMDRGSWQKMMTGGKEVMKKWKRADVFLKGGVGKAYEFCFKEAE